LHDLKIYINDHKIFDKEFCGNDITGRSTHDPVFVGAGTLMVSLEVRINKITIEGEDRWAVDVNDHRPIEEAAT
jgi:hypothetical protein